MNLGEVKNRALKLAAQYSNGGVTVSSGDNADYILRGNTFVDQAQKEVATMAKIHAKYSFSQNSIDPLNGKFYGFYLKQFLPGADLVDIQGANGQSFYTEIDRPCSIYIEESSNGLNWSSVSSVSWITESTTGTSNPIVVSGISSFTAYRGIITPSNATNLVRLKITGNYPANRRNTAIWSVPFASPSDVPIYNDRVEYTIPDTYWMEFNKIVHRTDNQIYEQMVDFSSIGRKTFAVNYFYTGSFDVWYFKVPNDITDLTLDSTELEVYPGMPQECIAYYVAAHYLMDEQPSLGTLLLNEYQSKLSNLKTQINTGIMQVYNAYGW